MKYVAFLRAINVGGHAIIKMADLKKMFEAAGLENVQTYIQSGNVIFESEEAGGRSLAKQIERQLEKAAEYKIELFVRTMQEVQSIAEKCPFKVRDGEIAYVTFLNTMPDQQIQQALLNLNSESDEFAFRGSEIHTLRRDREKSIFSNNFLEKILKMPATSRNLTTIRKIVEKYA